MKAMVIGGLGVALVVGCGGQAQISGGPDGSTTSNDATTGQDVVTGGDGSIPPNDGAPSGDVTVPPSGDGGSVGPIQCGMGMTCDGMTQVCCIAGPGAEMCVTKGSPCMGVTVTCTSAMSCGAGDKCCGDLSFGGDGGMGFNVNTSCQAQCPMGMGQFQLCASTMECPAGEDCRRGPAGFRVCRPAFDGGAFDAGPPPQDAGPG